jgi:two-component system, chemotaxis family, sensor kinase CheA
MLITTPAADLRALIEDRAMATLFISEAREHLSTIEGLVLQLEQAPSDRSLLDAIYRPFHTIKGNASAIGAPTVGALAHDVETLLDGMRCADQRFGASEADQVLAAVDNLVDAFDWLGRALQEGIPPIDTPVRRQTGVTASSVRVDTDRLDALVDIVGEIMILESMIHESAPFLDQPNAPIARHFGSLRHLIADLQRVSLSLRMCSLHQTFQRTERTARDVSRACGKSVDVVLSGEDVELDRRVIDHIGDSLMHLVRNAIDHGIEDADVRATAGKSPRARISLHAFHRDGMVCIQVADDGQGLDTARIRATAIARGLKAEDAAMLDSEMHRLIFEPGFSTATAITDISGRGVGMDVVRQNIEALGGRIEIHTASGMGTTFALTVPLTMATLRGVLTAAGDERYVVPANVLREVVPLSQCEIHEGPRRERFARVRELTLPFVDLADLLGCAPRAVSIDRAVVLCLEIDGRRAAVLADAVFGVQDFVVKPLAALERVPGFGGGAVLGDGRIGLILDGAGVFELMDLAERRVA